MEAYYQQELMYSYFSGHFRKRGMVLGLWQLVLKVRHWQLQEMLHCQYLKSKPQNYASFAFFSKNYVDAELCWL